jgi:hypothetical protein
MVRQLRRVLELPVSLSVGVLRQSASLTGRVVSWLLPGGRSGEHPVPPRAPEPARTGAKQSPASSDELAPARAKPRRQARPRGERPARARARKRPQRDNATERVTPATPVQGDGAAAPRSEAAPPPAPEASRSDEKSRAAGPEVPTSQTGGEAPSAQTKPREAQTGGEAPSAQTKPGEAAVSRPERVEPVTEPKRDVEHEPGEGTSVRAPDPHAPLNTPVGQPDPTEWPDPYEQRADPRDLPGGEEMAFGNEPHPPTGATSTSEPHPAQDPEAEPWEGPKRDRVDR